MSTKNPRLNLTMDSSDLQIIAKLAKKRKTSLSATAAALIREALEFQEDIYLSKLGDERLAAAKKWYSHEEAWKK